MEVCFSTIISTKKSTSKVYWQVAALFLWEMDLNLAVVREPGTGEMGIWVNFNEDWIFIRTSAIWMPPGDWDPNSIHSKGVYGQWDSWRIGELASWTPSPLPQRSPPGPPPSRPVKKRNLEDGEPSVTWQGDAGATFSSDSDFDDDWAPPLNAENMGESAENVNWAEEGTEGVRESEGGKDEYQCEHGEEEEEEEAGWWDGQWDSSSNAGATSASSRSGHCYHRDEIERAYFHSLNGECARAGCKHRHLEGPRRHGYCCFLCRKGADSGHTHQCSGRWEEKRQSLE